MKKTFIYAVACVALAAVAGWNYQQSKQNVELSDLALENVEALASGESIEEFCKNCVPITSTICKRTAYDGCLGYSITWEIS